MFLSTIWRITLSNKSNRASISRNLSAHSPSKCKDQSLGNLNSAIWGPILSLLSKQLRFLISTILTALRGASSLSVSLMIQNTWLWSWLMEQIAKLLLMIGFTRVVSSASMISLSNRSKGSASTRKITIKSAQVVTATGNSGECKRIRSSPCSNLERCTRTISTRIMLGSMMTS